MSEYRHYLINTLVLYSCASKIIANFTELCMMYPESDKWDDTLCTIARACQHEEMERRTQFNKRG